MFKVYEFHWTAKNRFGQKQAGKKLAENATQIEQALLLQGFEKIKIRRNFIFPTKPKSEMLTQYLNQLSLLLTATIPLKQSLLLLLENCTNIRLYCWLKQILTDLESGFSFSTALDKEGSYLNQQEIQLIKMGEKRGKLAEILNHIVSNRIKSEKLTQKIKKILFYPVMILAISIILSGLLLIFIVPRFAELYHKKSESLPIITRVLFSLSDFLTHFIAFIPIAIMIMGVIYLCLRRVGLISIIKHWTLSCLPLFNQIVADNRIVFFCRNSGLMLASHLRLDTILESFIQNRYTDPILHRELKLSLERLKQGYRLSESLDSSIFPQEILQMIAIGEKSGQLAQMLLHISEIYRQKLEDRTDILSQLLEPILMLIMGLIVGTVLIGLYLPIFDMGSMIE